MEVNSGSDRFRRGLARRRHWVGGFAAVLVISGCGTRLTHDRLVAAARSQSAAGASTERASGGTLAPAESEPSVAHGEPGLVATPSGSSAELGSGSAVTGRVPSGASGAVSPSGSAGSGTSKSIGSSTQSGGTGSTAPRTGGTGGGQATTVSTAQKPVPATCRGNETPIITGSVGGYSGVIGALLKPGTEGVGAWMATRNATGGIGCRKLKYIVYDSGGDPSRNQALVQRLVEQDHAIAILYFGAPLEGGASVRYIQEHRIPVIGEEGGNGYSCVNSMFFPVMSTCSQSTEGAYQILARYPAKEKGFTKVGAVSCVENPFCSTWGQLAAASAKAAGLELVYNGNATLSQPDYTSICLEAQRAGAQMLVLAVDGNSVDRLSRSCASVNYRPERMMTAGGVFPESPKLASMQGVYLSAGVRSAPKDHPGVAELLQALRTYAPGTVATNQLSVGWVAGKVFERALVNIGSAANPPTNVDVLEGLWRISNDDIGGMTRPLNFARDKPVPADPRCWFPTILKDGELKEGGARLCM